MTAVQALILVGDALGVEGGPDFAPRVLARVREIAIEREETLRRIGMLTGQLEELRANHREDIRWYERGGGSAP